MERLANSSEWNHRLHPISLALVPSEAYRQNSGSTSDSCSEFSCPSLKELDFQLQIPFFPVRFSNIPTENADSRGLSMATRLYVGNLSPETTRDDLNSLFGQVARVISVEIENRPATEGSPGLGSVEIDAGNVEDVVFKLGITEVDGRRLRVQRTRPKSCTV